MIQICAISHFVKHQVDNDVHVPQNQPKVTIGQQRHDFVNQETDDID